MKDRLFERPSLRKTVLGFRNKRRSDPISANILSNQILPPFSRHVCGMDMLPSLRPICQQHSFFRLKLHISNGAFESTVFNSVYLVVGYIVWNWRSTSAFRQAERFLFLNRWTPKTSEGNLPSWTDSSRAWKLGQHRSTDVTRLMLLRSLLVSKRNAKLCDVLSLT